MIMAADSTFFLTILLLVFNRIKADQFVDCRSIQCKRSYIICVDNQNCDIDCGFSDQACQSSIIICPENGHCAVNCDTKEACDKATIYAQKSNTLSVSCQNHEESCYFLDVFCPQNKGPNTCTISGFDDLFEMAIFAINGFDDVQFDITTTLPAISMHCGSDFDEVCVISPTFPHTHCLNDNAKCNPTLSPTHFPTNIPTTLPTNALTLNPTLKPTMSPTLNPTLTPSLSPTVKPTNTPTITPTNIPSHIPTKSPTMNPTNIPTNIPTNNPTNTPTNIPSQSPTKIPSDRPTNMPSESPSNRPTNIPSQSPAIMPSDRPTNVPSQRQTNIPSHSPSDKPINLSINPTNVPSLYPTNNPSNNRNPTNKPTISQTNPTQIPSKNPTNILSVYPTNIPTNIPTNNPTNTPSLKPTINPIITHKPTNKPTPKPTRKTYYQSLMTTTQWHTYQIFNNTEDNFYDTDGAEKQDSESESRPITINLTNLTYVIVGVVFICCIVCGFCFVFNMISTSLSSFSKTFRDNNIKCNNDKNNGFVLRRSSNSSSSFDFGSEEDEDLRKMFENYQKRERSRFSQSVNNNKRVSMSTINGDGARCPMRENPLVPVDELLDDDCKSNCESQQTDDGINKKLDIPQQTNGRLSSIDSLPSGDINYIIDSIAEEQERNMKLAEGNKNEGKRLVNDDKFSMALITSILNDNELNDHIIDDINHREYSD